MNTKIKFAAALTALTLATTLAAPSNEAHAGGRGLGFGIAAGLVGAAIVGTAIANSQPVYADGYRRCRPVRQYDAYGYYVGTARACNY